MKILQIKEIFKKWVFKQRAEIISKNLVFSKKVDVYHRLKDLLIKNKWEVCLKLCL